ncbi:MAG: hypothetical protein ACPGVZ_04120 [Myxococcota bacterium]
MSEEEPDERTEEEIQRREDEEEFPSFDDMIGTFFKEPSLLPIVVVVLGSGGAFGAFAMILTVVDRNPFAAAALVLMAGLTVDICLRARKESAFRNVAILIGLVWASSAILAGVAVFTGIATS